MKLFKQVITKIRQGFWVLHCCATKIQTKNESKLAKPDDEIEEETATATTNIQQRKQTAKAHKGNPKVISTLVLLCPYTWDGRAILICKLKC